MRAVHVDTGGGATADADHAPVSAGTRRGPLGQVVSHRSGRSGGASELSTAISEATARHRGDARCRVARRARPHRPGAAAPRRLRLRRHPRAPRRRPCQSRPAARGGRRRPRSGRTAADHGRGGFGSGPARPGDAVAAAERGAPRRQPRLGVRPRLHPAASTRADRAARPAAGRAEPDLAAIIPACASRPSRRASRCTSAESSRRWRADALDAVRRGPATWPDIHVTHGKEVVELSLIATDKGDGRRCAARAGVCQRRAVPRRRHHRRERLRPAPRPGCRHQDRRRRHRWRRTGSTIRSMRSAFSGFCSRPAGAGSTASTRCRSNGTRCSPTARPWRCCRPTRG